MARLRLIDDRLVLNDNKGKVVSSDCRAGAELLDRCPPLVHGRLRSTRNLGRDFARGKRAGNAARLRRAARARAGEA